MKLISIIIATFNVQRTIERCLNSIISQKREDIELIIIDGNSSDDSVKILQKNSNQIDYWISEPDQGIYDAWNKGITQSRGKWIMFVGADDYFLPGAFDVYRDFLMSNETDDLDLICAKCKIVDTKGNEIRIGGEPYEWHKFKRVMSISHGTTLHNRKLFSELGNFDLSYCVCADYDFLLRKHMRAGFINEVLFVFENAGASSSQKALRETYEIRKKHSSLSPILNIYYYLRGAVGLCICKMIN